MKKRTKSVISVLLAALFVITAIPFTALPAKALNYQYNAVAAATYGETWAKAFNPEWYNYVNGGDCANFVSQCLYMGGLPMTAAWHCEDGESVRGYAMNRPNSTPFTWIRADALKNYVVSIGGQLIRNPSQDQISLGDCIFYDWTGNGRMNHSAIVTSIQNGQPRVSSHSSDGKTHKNIYWTHGASSGWQIYLVKMYGATCNVQNTAESYSVYRSRSCYYYSSPASGYLGKIYWGDYIRVTEVRYVGSTPYGKFNHCGNIVWANLSQCDYVRYTEKIRVDHIMGGWYTVRTSNCVTSGLEQRVCSRCGYTEQRETPAGGHSPNHAATCTEPSVCTICGVMLAPALGHDWGDWILTRTPNCVTVGQETKYCSRCGISETRDTTLGDHNFVGADLNLSCVSSGMSTEKCEYCGKIVTYEGSAAEWSGWVYTAEDIANFKAQYKITDDRFESRTEYSYRDKSTTTSSSSSIGDGWIHYDTTEHLGDYGNWSGWQNDPIDEIYDGSVKIREVASQSNRTGYYLEYWLYTVSGNPDRGYYATQQDLPILRNHVGPVAVSDAELASLYTVPAGGQTPKEHNGWGKNMTNQTGYWKDTGWEGVYGLHFITGDYYQTQYRYRDRTHSYTYHFYRWSDWSQYSPTAVSATSTREVQTRTMYRVRLSALGHDMSGDLILTKVDADNNNCYTDDVDSCYKAYICRRCGWENRVEEGHKWGAWQTVAANERLNEQHLESVCSVCSEVRIKGFDKYTLVTEPTCTEEGYTVTVTKNSETGEVVSTSDPFDIVPALGHLWDYNWYTVVEPTCLEEGEERCLCKRECCEGKNVELSREIPATGHALELQTGLDPWCETDGYTDYWHCNNCDKYFADEAAAIEIAQPTEGAIPEEILLPALGHDMPDYDLSYVGVSPLANGPHTVEAAICGQEGVNCYICKRCGGNEIHGSYTLPHHYVEVPVAATCITAARTDYICDRCGGEPIVGDEEGDPLGHIWGNWLFDENGNDAVDENGAPLCDEDGWALTVAPTCENDGVYERHCIRCRAMYDVCMHDGQFDRCDAVEYKEIDALGHDWEEKTVAGTCTGEVITYKECGRCGKTDPDPIPVSLGHNMPDEWTVVTEATCLTPGLKVKRCTNDYGSGQCEFTVSEVIPAKGHNFDDEWEKISDPTCTEKGIEVKHCQNVNNGVQCDAVITKETAPLGHVLEPANWVVEREATYEAEGEERNYCKRDCGYYETKPIPQLPYKADFIVEDANGGINYGGKTYSLLSEVEYFYPAESIREPEVPEKNGFEGSWAPYVLCSAPVIYIPAQYNIIDTEPSEVTTEKTAEYNGDGTATINISAFSATKTIESKFTEATPLDIVLVVDQSGSMAENMNGKNGQYQSYTDHWGIRYDEPSRNTVLKDVAATFVEKVYDNAVAGGTDHRISIVGFASAGVHYNKNEFENTAILTPSVKNFKDATAADYRNSMLSVLDNKDALLQSVRNIAANGATAANIGLEMAENVLANSESKTEGRKRLVIFLTDGEPTYTNGFQSGVADSAISVANDLKNLYGATVYSIGITKDKNAAGLDTQLGRFLNYTSSNYPAAKSMTNSGEGSVDNSFYVVADNADTLDDIFSKIYYRSVINTVPFTDLTFHDVIAKEFTMTVAQENTFRAKTKARFAISDGDIDVIRNSDGTTTVEVRHVTPKRIVEGATGWGATITFDVTANEKALEAGVYKTNFGEAELVIDGGVAATYPSPEVTIPGGRNIVIFTMGDDEIYAMEDYDETTPVTAPECDYIRWNIYPDTFITDSVNTFKGTLWSTDRTVVWYIGEEVVTQTYKVGQLIVAPEVTAPEGMLFDGWNAEVPYRMPNTNLLTFTAQFGAHEHDYYIVESVTGDCESGITTVARCVCGDVSTVTTAPEAHDQSVRVFNLDGQNYAQFRCSKCGKYEFNRMSYTCKVEGGWTTLDLTMTEENTNVAVQPDGKVSVTVQLSNEAKAKIRSGAKPVVYYVDNNGRRTKLTDVTYDADTVTFVTDHFSIYVIGWENDDLSDQEIAEMVCGSVGHVWGGWVVVEQPDGAKPGKAVDTCTVCGATETRLVVDGVNSDFCPYCGNVHPGFIGAIIRFIHVILNFFKNLF